MYERWDAKRCRMRTAELLDEQLFCDLYDTLKEITVEYDEPSPAELWDEAAVRWKPLLAAKRPELAVGILQEELSDLALKGLEEKELIPRKWQAIVDFLDKIQIVYA